MPSAAISKRYLALMMQQHNKELAEHRAHFQAVVTGRVLNVIEKCEEPSNGQEIDLHTIVDIINEDGQDVLDFWSVDPVLANAKIFNLKTVTQTAYIPGFQLKPGIKRPDEAILKRMDGKLAEWRELNAQLSEDKRLPSPFPAPVLID
jgi:hypothetical protein